MQITIVYEFDNPKNASLKEVEDTVDYFSCEDRGIVDALYSCHEMTLKQIVDIKIT